MSIKVIGDKILIKKASKTVEGRNGIIVPESVRGEEHEYAEVVSVGEGQYLSSGQCAAPRVKVGDKLFYNHYAAVKVSHQDTEYFIITESDILFIEE